MYITVNKKTTTRRPVKYAALNSALSGATSSGVWHDEDTSAKASVKRTNRIKLTRAVKSEDYDA
jgi:hypothetical protein